MADQPRPSVSKSRYANDPSYGPKPRWSRLYDKHCPHDTDGCSRHVRMIAEDTLRDPKSEVRRWLIDQGYEPDHWARSMEITVRMLWEARAEIRQLKGPERVQREFDVEMAKFTKKLARRQASGTNPNPSPESGS